jgi:hypothetical protein
MKNKPTILSPYKKKTITNHLQIIQNVTKSEKKKLKTHAPFPVLLPPLRFFFKLQIVKITSK